MDRVEALRMMYLYLEGEDAFDSRTSAQVTVNDDDYEEPYIECRKDGHQCWMISKEDILFDYIATRALNMKEK